MSVFTIRAHKRFAVCRSARLRKAGRRGIDGLLIELSLDGCRLGQLGGAHGLIIGDAVIVRIEGTEPIEANIRWLGEGAIGLRFVRPLHAAGLQALIDLCRTPADPVRAYGT